MINNKPLHNQSASQQAGYHHPPISRTMPLSLLEQFLVHQQPILLFQPEV
jgi:hypothetical protein